MAKVLVIYKKPKSAEAFEQHYAAVPIPAGEGQSGPDIKRHQQEARSDGKRRKRLHLVATLYFVRWIRCKGVWDRRKEKPRRAIRQTSPTAAPISISSTTRMPEVKLESGCLSRRLKPLRRLRIERALEDDLKPRAERRPRLEEISGPSRADHFRPVYCRSSYLRAASGIHVDFHATGTWTIFGSSKAMCFSAINPANFWTRLEARPLGRSFR